MNEISHIESRSFECVYAREMRTIGTLFENTMYQGSNRNTLLNHTTFIVFCSFHFLLICLKPYLSFSSKTSDC